MALFSGLDSQSVGITILSALVSLALYRLFLHPLAHLPGPFLARVTSLWLYNEAWLGTEATSLQKLHAKYGPVVRIAPNEVDVSDGSALQSIYVKGGGAPKNACYSNYDIDDHQTIFSSIDNAHRAPRAKAVLGLFSQQAVRDGKDTICEPIQRMTERLEKEIKENKGKPIDVLNLCRSVALDAVTAYLFGKAYDGVQEEALTAATFVDGFVEVGRYFYLPKIAFKVLETITFNYEINFGPNRYKVWRSSALVDKYMAAVINESIAAGVDEQNTYQARLLKAGIGRDEVLAQCKDVMFAGTDSTGMNLASLLFHLAQNPDVYKKLRDELNTNPDADPQTLPYLSAVIKEGLRVAMANPTRMPRINQTEISVEGLPSIPAGSSVAACMQCLHFDEKVFPNPLAFEPERWLEASAEMTRDSIPFGLGPRACIARNLATAELYWTIEAVVRKDLLKGARTVEDQIDIIEWFNSQVKGRRIDLIWE